MSRTVLITGVTRGLGRAMAVEFAAHGHRVLGCGRDAAAVAALAEEIGAEGDLRALDVTDGEAVERWAAECRRAHAVPELLLNNAALINRNAPLWEVPREEFDRVVDVNIKGVNNLIRAFLPAMISAGRGVIVNFSSGWGRSTSPEVAPYCATKWAIEGLTQALAQELPSGLAAIPLSPGVVDTDMLRSTLGSGASAHQEPTRWARQAIPFLLALGPRDNGRSMTIPTS